MSCPLCGAEIAADSVKCKCGFYLDLAVEPIKKKDAKKNKQDKKNIRTFSGITRLLWELCLR